MENQWAGKGTGNHTAMELGATEFCTFDLRQSRMAAAAGLAVILESVLLKETNN